MAISMVRKPSETPNITNIDDIIPFRYAYGNQSGYVISRGAEVSHTVNGNQFTVNSGRLVIQGVESDIDANGITLTIDSVSETRYYAVYHEINLATNTSNIKVEFDTATYPNITEGDDLTANSSGIARLVLYNFIAQNGVISGVEKLVNAIEYSGTALVGYDILKGTVEERLTNLGFREGDARIDNTSYITQCHYVQEGNATFLDLNLYFTTRDASDGNVDEKIIARLPSEFKNFKEDVKLVEYEKIGQVLGMNVAIVRVTFTLKTDNTITFKVVAYQEVSGYDVTIPTQEIKRNFAFLRSENKNITQQVISKETILLPTPS